MSEGYYDILISQARAQLDQNPFAQMDILLPPAEEGVLELPFFANGRGPMGTVRAHLPDGTLATFSAEEVLNALTALQSGDRVVML